MNRKKDINKYNDIINLPRHVSKTKPQMSMMNRAAQFSSFAAVVGHGDAVVETARLTDQKIELDEAEKSAINNSLVEIVSNLESANDVEIVYFISDEKKSGGKYVKIIAKLIKYNEYSREVFMDDGTVISIDEILYVR